MTARIPRCSTIAFLGAILASGCSGNGKQAEPVNKEELPRVVVTIPPLKYFVDRIGGGRVTVECLAPASADPETFEPSMAQLRKASHAQLMLTTGLLPFEEKVTEAISSSNPGIRITPLNGSIKLIEGTHDHGDDGHSHSHEPHGNYDPHIWTSLRNARTMARGTYKALLAASPADSLYFKSRLDSLDHHLDSLDRATSIRLAPTRGKTILVWHPSLSYFARDYGLHQLTIGNEHKESSISGLKERLDLARREKPMVFFYQREYDSRQAETVTDATGLRPVTIAPLSENIEEAINKAADAIAGTATNDNNNDTSQK